MTAAVTAATAITPVVLTYNESPNIGRTLEGLRWAARVVVVDSGSTDDTERIVRRFQNASWFLRHFDTHGGQWEFAIRETGINSPYVLALDADYQVPAAFVEECGTRFLQGDYAGGIAGFEYHVLGRALMGSVYPPKPVIFRPAALTIEQPGHSQDMRVSGPLYRFASPLIHDDRKPLERFVASQLSYSRLEASRLETSGVRWQDRVRRSGLMPIVSGLGAYLRAGGPFRGAAALRYAYERVTFECLLAMRVLDSRPTAPSEPPLAVEHDRA